MPRKNNSVEALLLMCERPDLTQQEIIIEIASVYDTVHCNAIASGYEMSEAEHILFERLTGIRLTRSELTRAMAFTMTVATLYKAGIRLIDKPE